MLRSKGGKVQYFCPECGGSDISKIKVYGQISIECNECNTFGPWKRRVKFSTPIGSDIKNATTLGYVLPVSQEEE